MAQHAFQKSDNAFATPTDTTGQGVRLDQLKEDERPREKILQDPLAIKTLSDAELIAILTRTGTPRQNVLELSKTLLATYQNNLLALYKDLLSGSCQHIAGLGDVKKITILAGMELGLRIQTQIDNQEGRPTPIDSSQAVYHAIRHHFIGLTEEQMWVLVISGGYTLTAAQNVTRGGISEVTADIRTILRHVIRLGGPAFMVVHNHPGGTLAPSRQDDSFTQKLLEAARLLNLSLLDHLIITDHGYYSYHDHGNIL